MITNGLPGQLGTTSLFHFVLFFSFYTLCPTTAGINVYC